MSTVATVEKWAYKFALKPLLFQFPPDRVHNTFVRLGRRLGSLKIGRQITRNIFLYEHASLRQEIVGLQFSNPIGLSEGFDKNGDLVGILPSIGFGFFQIGSITNQPCEGNQPPFLYRLPKSRSIVVNYGLRNIGADAVMQKMRLDGKQSVPIGVSVAKTNTQNIVDIKQAIADQVACVQKVIRADVADFITLNISCPNVLGGEPFCNPDNLAQLLEQIQHVRGDRPLFLKVPINKPWQEFRKLVITAINHGVDALVIGNLNKNRHDPSIKEKIPTSVQGNLSGKPTWQLSNALIYRTYPEFGQKIVIIGVGGVFSAEDAYEKIKRGASLVQILTGMVFEGPQLIGEINRQLVSLLKRDGYQSVSQAVGAYHRSVDSLVA